MAASRLLERDLRSEFDQFVRYVRSPEAAPAFGPVEQQRGPGYDVLTKVAISGAGRAVRYFVAANPFGRFQVILAAASSENLFRAHEAEIYQFFESVEYENSSAAPAYGAPPAAAPPGTWQTGAKDAGGSQAALPSLAPLRPRPGWAIGRAVDAAGRPLKGAL